VSAPHWSESVDLSIPERLRQLRFEEAQAVIDRERRAELRRQKEARRRQIKQDVWCVALCLCVAGLIAGAFFVVGCGR
jgi:hypothetical protein